MFKKIKAILFDVGGTLIYTIKPLITAISMAFEQNKIEVPCSEEIIAQLGKSATTIITAILPKELSNFEEKAKECISSFQEIFPNKVLDEFNAIDGVQKTLKTLKDANYRLGVITALRKTELDTLLTKFNLNSYFEVIVTADDVQNIRPSPEIVSDAINLLNVQPREVICVGDTVNDILAAKNAGTYVIAVLTGAQTEKALRSENPDAIINNITALPSVLDKFAD
ncbi:MAG: HAD family hydrolase [Promethearchaeota archaeon]